jgi:hypothetical protein
MSSGADYKPQNFANVFKPCMNVKHVDSLCESPKDIVRNKLPWASESLPKIGNLAIPTGMHTDVLEKGMSLVNDIENLITENEKDPVIQKEQFKHLIEIAKHEQGNILQPLIYEDRAFKNNIIAMRRFKWFSPEAELSFTAGYDPYTQKQLNDMQTGLEEEEIVSKAKDEEYIQSLDNLYEAGTEIEDYDSRMKWIERAAEKYHDLMIRHSNYMESELSTISSWVNESDKFTDENAATRIY